VALSLAGLGLRLLRLSSTPGVYPDESYYIELSWNLLHLKFQWGLYTSSFLPRMPLPLMLMGIGQAIFGRSLFAIRLTTVLWSSLALPALGWLLPSRRLRPLLLSAMVLFICQPFAACYQRWGFTYNYLLPVMLAAVALRARLTPTCKTWPLMAFSLSVAALLLSEPVAIGLALVAWASLIPLGRRRFVLGIAASLLPLILYLALLLVRIPRVFWSDVLAIGSQRLGGGSTEPAFVSLCGALHNTYGFFFPLGMWGAVDLPKEIPGDAAGLHTLGHGHDGPCLRLGLLAPVA